MAAPNIGAAPVVQVEPKEEPQVEPKEELKEELKIEPKIELNTEPQESCIVDHPRIQPALDSIDELNQAIVDLWVFHFVQNNNTYTTVELMAQELFAEKVFAGEDIANVRKLSLSFILKNWEIFELHRRKGKPDVAKMKDGVYREAAELQRTTPPNSAAQDVVMDPSPPELAESTSTKPSGSEVAPKTVLVDERKITPEEFAEDAKRRYWNGKHYPKPSKGLNTAWAIEDISEYMDNLPKGLLGALPFHPKEFPILHAIQDFVKSWMLACSGPDAAFGFPDCSLNAIQSLGAGLHYMPPGKSVWIQNRQPEPLDMVNRSTYYHSLPPSRLLGVSKHGLGACLGAGYEVMEAAWGQPVLGAYVAKLEYAAHYPLSDCTRTDPMPENRHGVSGSQLLSNDGSPPFRCLIVLKGDPTRQLWHKHNQSVFPAGRAPTEPRAPYLYISHVCMYATTPRLMMSYYKDLFLV